MKPLELAVLLITALSVDCRNWQWQQQEAPSPLQGLLYRGDLPDQRQEQSAESLADIDDSPQSEEREVTEEEDLEQEPSDALLQKKSDSPQYEEHNELAEEARFIVQPRCTCGTAPQTPTTVKTTTTTKTTKNLTATTVYTTTTTITITTITTTQSTAPVPCSPTPAPTTTTTPAPTTTSTTPMPTTTTPVPTTNPTTLVPIPTPKDTSALPNPSPTTMPTTTTTPTTTTATPTTTTSTSPTTTTTTTPTTTTTTTPTTTTTQTPTITTATTPTTATTTTSTTTTSTTPSTITTIPTTPTTTPSTTTTTPTTTKTSPPPTTTTTTTPTTTTATPTTTTTSTPTTTTTTTPITTTITTPTSTTTMPTTATTMTTTTNTSTIPTTTPPKDCAFQDDFTDACAVVECDRRTEKYIFKGYDKKCPMCKTYLDPHIVTYDQRYRSYSYQGSGNYSLSQVGNSYNPDMAVYSTFKTCGGSRWVTCVDTVTFKIDKHTVFSLSYEKQIKIQVNGDNIDTEPSYTPSIVNATGKAYPVLIWKSRSCINLQGSTGILVKFCGSTWANYVYVYASHNVSADLEGLCGSINGDIDDDFVTRGGAVVSTWQRNPPKEFPLSWLTNAASNGSSGGGETKPPNRCEKNDTVAKDIQTRCNDTVTQRLPNAESGRVEALVDDCAYDMCNVNDPDQWLEAFEENLQVENETINSTIERPISPILPQECPKDPGYFVHSNQCFKFLHEGGWTNWTNANARCGLLGLVLAKPHDIVGLAKIILETFGNKGAWSGVHHIWLGGRGNGSEVIWDRDGSILPRNDSAWRPGHPSKTSSDRCLMFLTNQDDGQYYMVSSCNSGRYPLCEYTTTPPKKGNLTWHNVGSDRFARIPEYYSWFDSRRICQINGLDLYHPKNSTAVVIYLVENFGVGYYWLGARGNGTHQVWVDEGVLTYADPWYNPRTTFNNGTNDCLYLRVCISCTWTGKVLLAPVDSCHWTNRAILCG